MDKILAVLRAMIACLILLMAVTTQVVAQDILSSAVSQMKDLNQELTSTDLADFIVTDQYVSPLTGVTHIYLQQRVAGIDIRGASMTLNMNGKGTLLSYNSHFVANLADLVNTIHPSVSAEDAVSASISQLRLSETIELEQLSVSSEPDKETIFSGKGFSKEEVSALLEYEVASTGQVRLAWSVNIHEMEGKGIWDLKIDAVTGVVMRTDNRVLSCNHKGHSELDHITCIPDQPDLPPASTSTTTTGGSYNVFKIPFENPAHGNRSLITSPWNDNASPFGWHDVDGVPGHEYQITRGNNTWTLEDLDGDDATVGMSPNGGPDLEFDFPLNLKAAPGDNLSAAATNVFYWTNLVHDISYAHGFDENSGNFQVNNYGRGGLENDAVIADVMDASDDNNAHFTLAEEGKSPRMELHLWDAGPPHDIFRIEEPASIAGLYYAVEAEFGPGLNADGITGNLALALNSDGGSYLCEAASNPADLAGKIALVDRGGNCALINKVMNAQEAGAIACIVCNDAAGSPVMMPGSGPVSIPSVMIGLKDCDLIKAALAEDLTIKLSNSGSVAKSSDFDNGIIVHEYAHGISSRLTGGPSNVECLFNGEQMGEGISDWLAALLTIRAGDSGSDPRGFGAYVKSQGPTGVGLRAVPYSTDMTLNSLTYGDLHNASLLPGVHGVGTIWATMLWELTWNMIDFYGFDPDWYNGNGGNNRVLKLVMEGMRFQPCNPGFVDARDAILQADQALYGGANTCLIWEAFAKRGLGADADQGNPEYRDDGVPSFRVHSDCGLLPVTFDTIWANSAVGGILVEWRTASEANSWGFEVLRETEDSPQSEVIGWQDSKDPNSTTAQYYWFLDSSAVPGVKYFYRLRQVDMLGGDAFSERATATLNGTPIEDLKIYPNPTGNDLYLKFLGEAEGKIQAGVWNLVGTQVWDKELTPADFDGPIHLDLSLLPEGMYFVRLSKGYDSWVRKIWIDRQ